MNQPMQISQDNRWDVFKNGLRINAKRKRMPLSVTFELTPLCNFSCSMCYIHLSLEEQRKQKDLLSLNQWLTIAQKCKEAGVLFITLTGGEVCTYPAFKELYTSLYDMGFMITILSNGALIKDDILSLFAERKPLIIRITLYGASDETYQKVCQTTSNGFSTVSRNIQNMKELGINVATVTTLIEENQSDVDRMMEWAERNQLILEKSYRIRKQALRGASSRAEEVRIKPTADHISRDTFQCRNNRHRQISDAFEHCNVKDAGFIITWKGRMLGCNSLEMIDEDPFSGDIVSIFRRLWDRLSAIKLPSKCLSCSLFDYCHPCPGYLANESGDPSQTSDYMCDIAWNNYVQAKQINHTVEPSEEQQCDD